VTRFNAISDSANFYISVERILDPTLKNVPVIVLSNNDGCAVARSDEAKTLGIKMGEPLHLIRNKIETHSIHVSGYAKIRCHGVTAK
jgi:DNA polymerase V